MSDGIPDKPDPVRPGIPIDPMLQLWVGEYRRLPDVTWTGGLADGVAPANPMRVALYTWNIDSANTYGLAPSPGPSFPSAAGGWWPSPNALHVRDFPRAAQGEWVGGGVIGTTIGVAEYTLTE